MINRTCSRHILGDILGDILWDILGDILGDIFWDILGDIIGDILGDIPQRIGIENSLLNPKYYKHNIITASKHIFYNNVQL